jgi:hypothetical protein
MNVRKSLTIISSLILVCMVMLPAAQADEWNQATKMRFNEAVQIPGRVLPAGTYWFVVNGQNNQNLVQIFSRNWSRIYATVFTAPTERMEATGRTEIKFAERPHDRPEALYKWYYPGSLTGHEFLYSSKEEKELQRDAKLDLIATPLGTGLSTSTTGL